MRLAETARRVRHRRSTLSRALRFAGVLVGVGLLVAGCGGSKAPAVASVGAVTASSSAAPTAPVVTGGSVPVDSGSNPAGGPAAVFDACIRAHGVPNMPGPGEGMPAGFDQGSQQFQKAVKECLKLVPQDAPPADVSHPVGPLLAFAKCMRSLGVTTFPDPNSQGQFDESGMAGIDRESSIFQTALKACRPLADNEPIAARGRVSP